MVEKGMEGKHRMEISEGPMLVNKKGNGEYIMIQVNYKGTSLLM